MGLFSTRDKLKIEKRVVLWIIMAIFISTPTVALAEESVPVAEEIGPGFVKPEEQESKPAGGPTATGPGMEQPVREQLPDPGEIVGDIRNLETDIPIVLVTEKYSYEQMTQDIATLSSVYGDLVKVNVIGQSLDKRDIYEVIIGNPDSDRHILIQAGIHGREHMTSLLVMRQMELALYSYRKGSYNVRPVYELLNQAAIHFVPMSNPDGIALSQFGLGAIRSEELRNGILYCYESDRQMGRTSSGLEAYLSRWKANARGVDLNNNFNAGWELIEMLPAPSFASYKGQQPFSEPETQTLFNLANQRIWTATVSYHAAGRLIYWDFPVNNQRDASRHLGNMVAGVTGYRTSLSPNSYGGFKDWMQASENSAPSVTLEIGMGTCPLPISDFPQIWGQNKAVWAAALEFALPQ